MLDVIDNQVRSLRKRQAIEAFINPDDDHDGTYWGIRTHIADCHLPDALRKHVNPALPPPANFPYPASGI